MNTPNVLPNQDTKDNVELTHQLSQVDPSYSQQSLTTPKFSFPNENVVPGPILQRTGKPDPNCVYIKTIDATGQEKHLSFCRKAVELGSCDYGIRCKYSHPYEYEIDPRQAAKMDTIISMMGEIMGSLARMEGHLGREIVPHTGRGPRREKVNLSYSDQPQHQERQVERGNKAPEKRPQRKRSTSRARLSEGTDRQSKTLTDRLAKYVDYPSTSLP